MLLSSFSMDSYHYRYFYHTLLYEAFRLKEEEEEEEEEEGGVGIEEEVEVVGDRRRIYGTMV